MLKPVSFHLSLIVLSILITTFPSYADLGLDQSDFGGEKVNGSSVKGKPVKGNPVTGKPITYSGSPTTTHIDPDEGGISIGLPGGNTPTCQEESGNGSQEGASCNLCPKDSKAQSCDSGQCAKSQSYVNLFTRRYQDEHTDMSVKAPGGFLKIYRIHDEGRWQFEHDNNCLDLSKAKVGSIGKSTLTYKKGANGNFHYKTFTIEQKDNQYRWQNKWGDYVLYSANGKMIETGNRIGVLAKYRYENGKLLSINDRNDIPAYYFEYDTAGKIIKVSDGHGRSVSYTWQDNNLLQVTDVLGYKKTYKYSEANQLISKFDEAGRKFFITYHPDGAVKSVLSRKGGGHFFSYKQIEERDEYYAKITTTMGNIQEYWFSRNGDTIKIKENNHLVLEDTWNNGQRISTDEVGNRTVKSYDKNDNLMRCENPCPKGKVSVHWLCRMNVI